jgi:hypothetical protein
VKSVLMVVGLVSAWPMCAAAVAPAHAQTPTMNDAAAPASEAQRTSEASPAVAEPFRLDFGAMQDQPALDDAANAGAADDWRVDVTAWMWLSAMNGDVGVGPLDSSVDASFSDILEASDSLFAFAGRLEVGRGRWAGFVDGMFSSIGADDMSGPAGVASVDVVSDTILVDFGLMYRALEKPSSSGGGRPHALDLYIGGRYQNLELELDPSLGATRSRSRDWLDPLIGARAIIQLSERFDLSLVGDIGGVGVGSDLTWSLRAVAGYHFTMFDTPATVFAGYAVLGTDYEDGSGPGRFEWDMILHGPVLGLRLSF